MAQQVDMVPVWKGNHKYIIPKKLIEYSVSSFPKEPAYPGGPTQKGAMDWYIIFAAQRPSTVVKFIERYHDIWTHNFPLGNAGELVCTESGEKTVMDKFHQQLEAKTKGHMHKTLFEYFKPLIAGFLDPAYIIYTIATRRPDLYMYILNKDGGFEWVRNLALKIKRDHGMQGQYMLALWEMQIVMPSTKKLLEQLDELEKQGKLPQGF